MMGEHEQSLDKREQQNPDSSRIKLENGFDIPKRLALGTLI